MNITISVLLVVLFVGALLGACFVLSMIWVARGESDVNSSPERDAGLPPTASPDDLDAARSSNRTAMLHMFRKEYSHD